MSRRRRFLAFALSFAAAPGLALAQAALPTVEVYKNPSCGCCGQWIEHMRQAGFKVVAHDVPEAYLERRRLGMPDAYGSCHTAQVGGYVLEGHVPAADVHRLLKERPKALGLAVPGMPAGSPGMEGPPPQPFETLLVARDGASRVYARH